MKFTEQGTGQIEKSCSTEESRYNLQDVYFDAERGHLVATDGRMMAISQATAEAGDVTGWITPESLVAYRQMKAKLPVHLKDKSGAVTFQALENTLVLTDHKKNQRIFQRPHFTPGCFPKYDAVMPKKASDSPAFLLDIVLLKKLVDSLGYPDTLTGHSNMIAVFPPETVGSAVLVKTTMGGPIGIIMPMRAPDEKSGWLTTIEQVDARYDVLRGKVAKPEVAEKKLEEPEREIEAADTAADEPSDTATVKLKHGIRVIRAA